MSECTGGIGHKYPLEDHCKQLCSPWLLKSSFLNKLKCIEQIFFKYYLRTPISKWIRHSCFQSLQRLAYNSDSRCANVNSMADIEVQASSDMKEMSSRLDDLEKVVRESIQRDSTVTPAAIFKSRK
jgi:hypothetical protein